MILCNNRYSVIIAVEVKPLLDKYDVIYNPEGISTGQDDFYSARILRIHRNDGSEMTMALLDMICSSSEPCAVLTDHILTVIQFHAILRIDLEAGEIIQHVNCDNIGGLFEIRAVGREYILYGEGEIFRYDQSLKRIWSFSGHDILVSQSSKPSFWIENDCIHCRDWEGWHYVLDLEGKLISESREKSPHS